jgi:hypothetical protein
MMSVEEAAKATQNKNTDPLHVHLLKKKPATKKLEEGQCMTAGVRVYFEGHHVGQFALDIMQKTREKKDQI